jgi:hypothetical protein
MLRTSLETDPNLPFLAMVGRYIRFRVVDTSNLSIKDACLLVTLAKAGMRTSSTYCRLPSPDFIDHWPSLAF